MKKMRVDSRKFLSVGLLLLMSVLAVNGATTNSKGTDIAVKDVSIETIGDSLEVKIASSDEARFTYFELARPARLVIDFHGVQNNIAFKEKRISSTGVE